MSQFPMVMDESVPSQWQLVGRSIEEGYSFYARPSADLLRAVVYLFAFLLGLEVWEHYFPVPLFGQTEEETLMLQSLLSVLAYYPFLMFVLDLMIRGQGKANFFSYYTHKILWRVILTDLIIYGLLVVVLFVLILPPFAAATFRPEMLASLIFWAVNGVLFVLVFVCLWLFMRVFLTDIHVAHGHPMAFKKIFRATKGHTLPFLILLIAVSLPGIFIEILERALFSTPEISSFLKTYGPVEIFVKTLLHVSTYAFYAVMWCGIVFFYRHLMARASLVQKT